MCNCNKTSALVFYCSGCCFLLLTMSLFLCSFLLYVPQKENFANGTCTVTECEVTMETCSRCTGGTTKQSCHTDYYTCYLSTFYYTLQGTSYGSSSGTVYDSQKDALSRCDEWSTGKAFTCYYDKRDPKGSLSTIESFPLAGGISSVVIFTFFAFVCLVVATIAGYYYLINYWSCTDCKSLLCGCCKQVLREERLSRPKDKEPDL